MLLPKVPDKQYQSPFHLQNPAFASLGLRFIMFGSAFSVPSASAGKQSVTRLIHRRCTGCRIVKPEVSQRKYSALHSYWSLTETGLPSGCCHRFCGPLPPRDNRRKIIVRQHHICHIFGNVRSCDAHSDADVRSLDGGRVVNAVTGHCRHMAGISPGVYDTGLVLWLYAGINADVPELLCKFCIVHFFQLCSGHCQAAILQNTNSFAIAAAVSTCRP